MTTSTLPAGMPTWTAPPASSNQFIVFSPFSMADKTWVEANQVNQDQALQTIYLLLQQVAGSIGATSSVTAQLAVLQAEVAALTKSVDNLSSLFIRPVTGRISVNGKYRAMPTPIPDSDSFSFAVVYDDLAGQVVPENAPTAWSVLDLTGAVSTLATLTIDPTSDQKGTGVLTAASGSFILQAAMGTLTLHSDELDIVPGSPAVGVISVSLVVPPTA